MRDYILNKNPKTLAVAPMMDWTDRHCRYFHRLMSSEALLYSEMVVADAVIHGDRDHILGYDQTQHPVAVQIGGSEPKKLAQAAKIAADYGYDEINLNVGCPSDRVQSGTFGACLMREPELVGNCVAAMKAVVDVPVTVKCRIGVDEQDTLIALDNLAGSVWKSGADALWVHARKAWLQGLSPKENRDIPPLDYDRVYQLAAENQERFVGINGGIQTLEEAELHLQRVNGVMLGRVAYHNPSLLREVDQRIYNLDATVVSYADILDSMTDYAERHLVSGGRLNQITRHMIGLFQGIPGARAYRQILSTQAVVPGAGPEVLTRAFDAVMPQAQSAA